MSAAKSAAKPKRFKLVVVGDGACGKTSLLMYFKTGRFNLLHEPTIFDTDGLLLTTLDFFEMLRDFEVFVQILFKINDKKIA